MQQSMRYLIDPKICRRKMRHDVFHLRAYKHMFVLFCCSVDLWIHVMLSRFIGATFLKNHYLSKT